MRNSLGWIGAAAKEFVTELAAEAKEFKAEQFDAQPGTTGAGEDATARTAGSNVESTQVAGGYDSEAVPVATSSAAAVVAADVTPVPSAKSTRSKDDKAVSSTAVPPVAASDSGGDVGESTSAAQHVAELSALRIQHEKEIAELHSKYQSELSRQRDTFEAEIVNLRRMLAEREGGPLDERRPGPKLSAPESVVVDAPASQSAAPVVVGSIAPSAADTVAAMPTPAVNKSAPSAGVGVGSAPQSAPLPSLTTANVAVIANGESIAGVVAAVVPVESSSGSATPAVTGPPATGPPATAARAVAAAAAAAEDSDGGWSD